MIAVRAPSSWRARLFAVATVALSGVFTVLMFRSLKLVADAWFIGCAFHADGTKICRFTAAHACAPKRAPLGARRARARHRCAVFRPVFSNRSV